MMPEFGTWVPFEVHAILENQSEIIFELISETKTIPDPFICIIIHVALGTCTCFTILRLSV